MERTGGDFESKHAQLTKEQKMRDKDGLTTAASASAALQPPVQPADAQPSDAAAQNQQVEAEWRGQMLAALNRELPAPVIHVDARTEVHPQKIDVAAPQVTVEPAKVDVTIAPASIEVHAHIPKKGGTVRTATKFDGDNNVIEMTETELDG
jgi:hypothetical protein